MLLEMRLDSTTVQDRLNPRVQQYNAKIPLVFPPVTSLRAPTTSSLAEDFSSESVR